MNNIQDLLIKLSPIAYLTLGWTVLNYFLQRKHKAKEKKNEESKDILIELLDVCISLTTAINEFVFHKHKDISKLERKYETTVEDNLISTIIEENVDHYIANKRAEYSTEEWNELVAKTFQANEELIAMKEEIYNLKLPSTEFTSKLEALLDRLNSVKVILVDNPNQLILSTNEIKALIQKYVLATISDSTGIKLELDEISTNVSILSTSISKRLKQL